VAQVQMGQGLFSRNTACKGGGSCPGKQAAREAASAVTRRDVLVSDKVRTEAGPFIPARTVRTVLKQEHWWLEK
jgi:hypothetical protein